MWPIKRTKPGGEHYGFAIPVFIRNGLYFVETVDVYSDGAIDAWGFVDLQLFDDKLQSGWVSAAPPKGSRLGVHDLGDAVAKKVDWRLTEEDLRRRVHDAIRLLNPTLENLIDMQGSDCELRGNVRYAKLGLSDSKPYRTDVEGRECLGDAVLVFEQREPSFRLVRWVVFADKTSQFGAEAPLLSLDEACEHVRAGKYRTSVPDGKWVEIEELGSFVVKGGRWGVDPIERVREVKDRVEILTGGDGSIRRCIEAHAAYNKSPSEESKDLLRHAYEAVPEHRRIFCGDMDSKDWPIRQILYGDDDERLPWRLRHRPRAILERVGLWRSTRRR